MKKTLLALLATAAIGTSSSMIARAASENGSPAFEKNKAIVVAFYNKALNEKDINGALAYVGAHYKQHNPTAEDDREGFRKFITWVRADHPDSHSEIKQVFADGDYVILNVHMVRHPGERGLAIAEIFRLEAGRIVEHWDRIQAVPETAKNANTMF